MFSPSTMLEFFNSETGAAWQHNYFCPAQRKCFDSNIKVAKQKENTTQVDRTCIPEHWSCASTLPISCLLLREKMESNF